MTGVNPVARIVLDALSVNGAHLGSLVKPTSGLNSIIVRNASITDGYTMPPIFTTMNFGYLVLDEASKYVLGSIGAAFTEIRDNTGSGDTRTRFLQNTDSSLGVLFWTGSAYAERLRFDTQNSQVYLGAAGHRHQALGGSSRCHHRCKVLENWAVCHGRSPPALLRSVNGHNSSTPPSISRSDLTELRGATPGPSSDGRW